MPNTPTTRSQVQAYRFVIRRMESAVARKDAVMVHDPMRTHVRALIVGLLIGALLCGAFALYGFIRPQEDLSDSTIVVGKESGATFVVAQDPLRLIPVHNITSARLLLAALTEGSGGDPATVDVVEEDVLSEAPRTALTGMPGAPSTLPSPEKRVPPEWALCDTAEVNQALPDAQQRPEITTSALIGLDQPGRVLPEDEALYVRDITGRHYLVFNGRRGEINPANAATVNAFRLENITPRLISTGLLNAIPAGPSLNPPTIRGDGEPSPFPDLISQNVGTAVRVDRAGADEFYVVLRDGVQRISRTVADLILYQDEEVGAEFPTVRAEDINRVPFTSEDSPHYLDVAGYPGEVPSVVPMNRSRVACLNWSAGADNAHRTEISVAPEMPLPEGMQQVRLPTADGESDALDYAFLPPGQAALVRGVVPGQDPGTGTIQLVTDQGMAYGIPSLEVARALGLGEVTQPAPESILRLLPRGPELDPQAAVRMYNPEISEAG